MGAGEGGEEEEGEGRLLCGGDRACALVDVVEKIQRRIVDQ